MKAGLRFVAPAPAPISSPITLVPPDTEAGTPRPEIAAAARIRRVWFRWIARRAGPLLHNRAESNNPFDFYSSDPVAEIPLRYFISFVDTDRKGYSFDSRSVTSLLAHQDTNPFNRAPLPPYFLRRLARHGSVVKQEALQPVTAAQAYSLEVTDTFRHFEDLGYYTDPGWFLALNRIGLQRLYMELADIWYHRAMLTRDDRARIVPSGQGLPVPVSTVIVMTQKALEHTVIRACRLLVSSAVARSDKQLGVMYVLGSLSLVSPDAAFAYPWLVDMFAPGVTRIHTHPVTGAQSIHLSHAAVMGY
jgi:hypothetical protein